MKFNRKSAEKTLRAIFIKGVKNFQQMAQRNRYDVLKKSKPY